MISGKTLTVRPSPFFLILILATAVAPAVAASSWTLAQLTALLARQDAATYRYAEERQLQVLTKPLQLRGTLSFEPGGRLEMQVLAPKKERIVIDGKLVSIEANKADPPTRLLLADYPALNSLVTALRSTLSGDHDSLAALYETELAGGQSDWSLKLTPRGKAQRAAVERIQIRGQAGEIGSIEILEADGDRAIITILGQL